MLEGNRFVRKGGEGLSVRCKTRFVCAMSRFAELNNHLSLNYHRASFLDCCGLSNGYYGAQG